MPKVLTETAHITEAAAAAAKTTGRLPIQFISPGWGSSGYYSPEVLAEAATNKVIPAGTHMYADHPTEAEDIERPGRSLKDLMAVTVGDATLAEDGALVGEVDVVPQWRDLLETVRDAIGVSIRGSATDIVEGEAEGRRGRIIEGLVAPVFSVDFVTRAGRGGKILPLLESAKANRRAIEHGVSEATVNDTREQLSNLLKDAYGAEKVWVYVRDFDDSTVWFEISADTGDGMYAQAYSQTSDGAVALSGDRTEVRVVTTYVPTTRSDSTNTNTQESEEDTMPNIEESELARLREADGRVPTLTTERDTAVQERDEARRELAEARARDGAATHARTRVTEANATLPTAAVDRIVAAATATIPLTESGQLDETALNTAVDAARTAEEKYLATLVESTGGGLTGFGESTDGTVEESKPTTTPWGRPLTVKGA